MESELNSKEQEDHETMTVQARETPQRGVYYHSFGKKPRLHDNTLQDEDLRDLIMARHRLAASIETTDRMIVACLIRILERRIAEG